MRAASGSSSARALADGAVAHGELLPAELVARVPHREKLVLSFVLAFLEANALPAQLLVNGGYVRDLLLGSVPDDLDLSLCLRECDPAVTVATVMHGLPGFALERPELNVSSVTITTILSDASKDKNVDTAKAHLVVGSPPERIEVDFMPTIGEETYDEFNRVPERDVRGTPEQDALRRDLTIGAMLLHVFQPRGSGPSGGGGAAAPEAAAEALQWRLLDFYGGLADLQRRVLRSPYPAGADASLVRASVLRYAEERELARKMGLLPSDGAAGSPARSDSPAPAGAAGEGAEALQVVWWIKARCSREMAERAADRVVVRSHCLLPPPPRTTDAPSPPSPSRVTRCCATTRCACCARCASAPSWASSCTPPFGSRSRLRSPRCRARPAALAQPRPPQPSRLCPRLHGSLIVSEPP